MDSRDAEMLARNVLYQRTKLGRFTRSKFLKRRLHVPVDTLIKWDAKWRTGSVLSAYRDAMNEEWGKIAPALPAASRTFMDIGCGVAGIHDLSYAAFKGNDEFRLCLVDRNQIDENIYYGYEAKGSAYNSLDLSRTYLRSRGLPNAVIQTIDVNQDKLPEDQRFDVIMSLISWGFHYPVDTYLEYVKRVLAPSGVLVLDCRVGKPGEDLLKENFSVSVIEETRKYTRLRCTH